MPRGRAIMRAMHLWNGLLCVRERQTSVRDQPKSATTLHTMMRSTSMTLGRPFRGAMGADSANKQDAPSWESVHVCPNCGHVINLAELDLRAITTGIVTCPSCDWSGQIEIQIIDQVPRKKPVSRGFASPKINEFGRVRQEEFPGTTFSLDRIPSTRYATN